MQYENRHLIYATNETMLGRASPRHVQNFYLRNENLATKSRGQ